MMRGARAATCASWVTRNIVEPCCSAKRHEEVEDRGTSGGVEIAGRLVGEDDTRLIGQRTSDRDALLFTTRKLTRQMVTSLGQPDLVEQLHTSIVTRTALHTRRRKRGFDVLGGCQCRDQIELLEHEAESAQPKIGEPAVGE